MDDVEKLKSWEYMVEVLKIFRELDMEDELYWHFHAKPYDWQKPEYVEYPTFAVSCSDSFHWASADGEEIEPEDIPLLKQCIEDLKATGAEAWGAEVPLLYAARKRGMRPMRLWLQRLRTGNYGKDTRTEAQREEWESKYGETHEKMYQLFIAAGPERTRESEG